MYLHIFFLLFNFDIFLLLLVSSNLVMMCLDVVASCFFNFLLVLCLFLIPVGIGNLSVWQW